MKIAQISPLYEAVPPKLYGGTERVVAHLADALVAAGHDITLFAAGDAQTTAKLAPMRDQSIRLDPMPLKSDLAAHFAMLDEVRQRAEEFDVLHFHIDLLHFPFFQDTPWRTLTTLHGRLDLKDLPEAYACWPQFPLASISDSQRRPLPSANWAGTVHHGLPTSLYEFSPTPRGGYLAFLGRISPEKRLDRAIAIARRAGLPLKVAAKVDAVDRAYFQHEIEPLLDDPMVEFVGEINDAQKSDFLGGARGPAVSHRLAGTVRAGDDRGDGLRHAGRSRGTAARFPKCSTRDVTGMMVGSLDEAVQAVQVVARYDRGRIRARFEQRFSAAAMARRYVELYWRVLEQGGNRIRLTA